MHCLDFFSRKSLDSLPLSLLPSLFLPLSLHLSLSVTVNSDLLHLLTICLGLRGYLLIPQEEFSSFRSHHKVETHRNYSLFIGSIHITEIKASKYLGV